MLKRILDRILAALTRARPPDHDIPITPELRCPQCDMVQHYVCSNKFCLCREWVPEGALTQVVLDDDVLACPYCGFRAHMDYWEERSMALYNDPPPVAP